MPKDLFSTQADTYARYRPTYPQELYDHIFQFVSNRQSAWDCATGNGQAASILSDYFTTVEATDVSEAQLKNAAQKPNIHYQISAAEQTPFADDSFDLITVATAYHWLDWTAFKAEATRVGKRDCVMAVWAYNLVRCADEKIAQAIDDFYHNTMYPYWDGERRHVEQAYKTVAFDYEPLPSKEFTHTVRWRREDLLGYISSWSALKNYTRLNQHSPLPIAEEKIKSAWPTGDEKEFWFPLFLRLGWINK